MNPVEVFFAFAGGFVLLGIVLMFFGALCRWCADHIKCRTIYGESKNNDGA